MIRTMPPMAFEPEFISRSRETVGRSVEIGALRRWFADLQLGKAFGGREEAFAIVVQDEAVISR